MRKTKRNWIFVCLSSFLFIHPTTIFACEPCHPSAMLSLADTINKAELIIIGKRHDPPLFNDNKGNDGPSTIDIEVERVLKGNLKKKIIKAASWYGMCGYGVVLHREKALLLLRKGPSSYEVVNPVCGNNQFIIIDNKLTRISKRGKETMHEPFMSIQEFIDKHIKQ